MTDVWITTMTSRMKIRGEIAKAVATAKLKLKLKSSAILRPR